MGMGTYMLLDLDGYACEALERLYPRLVTAVCVTHEEARAERERRW